MKQSMFKNLLSRNAILLAALLTLTGLTAQAQDFYLFGETSFHYEQVWGPLEGDFFAEGAIDTTSLLPSGVFGIEYPDSTSTTLLSIAVAATPDSTLDVFGYYLTTEGVLEPGNYPISTTNLFFFIVGADSFLIPENPDSIDIMDLIDLIQADYKFVSTLGSINITTVEDGVCAGTFSGLANDIEQPLTAIQVEQGEFSMLQLPEATQRITVPPTLELSCYPNPFNPETTVKLIMERPTAVTLEAFNLQGQLIEQLFQGQLAAGQHRFQFEPAAVASGTYLIRAVTPTEQISRRVQYLK
jgi:hypothetical protein